MRIVLTTPPSKPIVRDMAGGLGFDSSVFTILPPLDLLLQATVLVNKKHQVLIIDCLAQNIGWTDFLTKSKNFAPTHFIITVSLPTLNSDCQFAKKLKQMFPQSIIVIKFNLIDKKIIKEVLQKSQANFCFFSDNELLIENVLNFAKNSGTAILLKNKLKIFPQKLLNNLNKLPIPQRSLINNSLYRYHLLGTQPATSMQTSRGCPMPCGFYCPYPLVQGKIWRAQSPARIVKELLDIVQRHKIKNIIFRDAIFTLNRTRITKLCQMVLHKKLKFNFWCETRINFVDFELLKLMKKSGLIGVNIGVETGDEKLMTSQAKPGINLNNLNKVKTWCDQLRIKLNFLMMIGLPQDSKSSIYKSYQLLKKLKPEFAGLTIATPYPGTQFYKFAQKNHWLKKYDWDKYGGHNAVALNKYLKTKDLEFAYHTINDLFYLLKNPSIKNKIKFLLKEAQFKQWLKK